MAPDALVEDAESLPPDAAAAQESDAAAVEHDAGPPLHESGLPSCVPGQLSACAYDIGATRGTVSWMRQGGDYVYWVEPGTFDGFNNYQYDGLIARTKLGEWVREEVVTEIDCHDELSRQLIPVALFANERYLLWEAGSDKPHLLRLDGSEEVQTLEAPANGSAGLHLDQCSLQGDDLFCVPGRLVHADLSRGPEMSVVAEQVGRMHMVASGWFYGYDYNYQFIRLPSGGGEREYVGYPGATLLDAPTPNLWLGTLIDGRLGVATPSANNPRWTAVSDLVRQYLGYHEGWVYWSSRSSEGASVYRSRVDKPESELVGSHKIRSAHAMYGGLQTLGQRGLAQPWGPQYVITAVVFIPFPAD